MRTIESADRAEPMPGGSIVPESAVEYEPLVHRLIDAERRQYDEIADLWLELLIAFEAAEQNACQKRNAGRYAQFYSAQQRFFLQLMMAYALPDVIPEVEKDLAQGRSVESPMVQPHGVGFLSGITVRFGHSKFVDAAMRPTREGVGLFPDYWLDERAPYAAIQQLLQFTTTKPGSPTSPNGPR